MVELKNEKILIFSTNQFYFEAIEEALKIDLSNFIHIKRVKDLHDCFLLEKVDILIIDKGGFSSQEKAQLAAIRENKPNIKIYELTPCRNKNQSKKMNFLDWLTFDKNLVDLVLKIKQHRSQTKLKKTNNHESKLIRKNWRQDNIVSLFRVNKLSPLKKTYRIVKFSLCTRLSFGFNTAVNLGYLF